MIKVLAKYEVNNKLWNINLEPMLTTKENVKKIENELNELSSEWNNITLSELKIEGLDMNDEENIIHLLEENLNESVDFEFMPN